MKKSFKTACKSKEELYFLHPVSKKIVTKEEVINIIKATLNERTWEIGGKSIPGISKRPEILFVENKRVFGRIFKEDRNTHLDNMVRLTVLSESLRCFIDINTTTALVDKKKWRVIIWIEDLKVWKFYHNHPWCMCKYFLRVKEKDIVRNLRII